MLPPALNVRSRDTTSLTHVADGRLIQHSMTSIIQGTPLWEQVFPFSDNDTDISEVWFKGFNIPAILADHDNPRVVFIGSRDIKTAQWRHTVSLVNAIARSAPQAIIITGLSLGTEQAAAEAALDNGLRVVAALSHGIDIDIYPSIQAPLAERIIEAGGGLVTNMAPGEAPLAMTFLRRTHLMVALGKTLVIPACRRRGAAMVAAKLAAQKHRYHGSVFALPGELDDLRAEGCNRLIADGAARALARCEDIELYL